MSVSGASTDLPLPSSASATTASTNTHAQSQQSSNSTRSPTYPPSNLSSGSFAPSSSSFAQYLHSSSSQAGPSSAGGAGTGAGPAAWTFPLRPGAGPGAGPASIASVSTNAAIPVGSSSRRDNNANHPNANGNNGAIDPDVPPSSTAAHSSPEQVEKARAALVATFSNLIDTKLQSRAQVLHQNASGLEKQERELAKATEGLRKENEKLAKVAKDAGRKIKELGNVQNWAEVLERDFLVLEETARLVREGGVSDSEGSECSCEDCWRRGSRSGSGSRSVSGSRSRSRSRSQSRSRVRSRLGSEAGDRAVNEERNGVQDGDGDVRMDGIDHTIQLPTRSDVPATIITPTLTDKGKGVESNGDSVMK